MNPLMSGELIRPDFITPAIAEAEQYHQGMRENNTSRRFPNIQQSFTGSAGVSPAKNKKRAGETLPVGPVSGRAATRPCGWRIQTS
jgi:hypothetical protein